MLFLIRILLLFLVVSAPLSTSSYSSSVIVSKANSDLETSTRIVPTIFGPVSTNDSIICELIDSAAMQRLKGVDIGGPPLYFGRAVPFTRFSHSIGVWALLKRFNCTLDEQVAGLLHDVSHTAFSHLADVLFKVENPDYSYQDENHLIFIEQTDILSILQKHAFSLEKVNPDLPIYRGLEQLVPNMCADRIEYLLHTGILYNKITLEEALLVLDDIRFNGSDWYLTNIKSAEKIANLSCYFTKNIYESPWNKVMYTYFKDAIQKAIEIGLITKDEFLMGVDLNIMEKLNSSTDEDIQCKLTLCHDVEFTYDVLDSTEIRDGEHYNLKSRAINPLVDINGNFVRLTECSEQFNAEYQKITQWCAKGYQVNYRTR